jgi:antitoxin CptB
MSRALDQVSRNRLYWKCRRGLLELDLVLTGFIPTLRDEDLQPLQALLDLPDNDLWDIIIGRSDQYDRRFEETVARLRATKVAPFDRAA